MANVTDWTAGLLGSVYEQSATNTTAEQAWTTTTGTWNDITRSTNVWWRSQIGTPTQQQQRAQMQALQEALRNDAVFRDQYWEVPFRIKKEAPIDPRLIMPDGI